MDLLKEYRWWLLFTMSLFVIVYFIANRQLTLNGKEDLIKNWNDRGDKITETKDYFLSISPDGYNISVQIDSKGSTEINILKRNTSRTSLTWKYSTDGYIKLKDGATLNLTKDQVAILSEKLQSSHCISIAGTDPVHMGYKKEWPGMYFYNLFSKEISSNMIKAFDDSCRYIYYNSKLVFEYNGGAFGSQCFPEFKQKVTY